MSKTPEKFTLADDVLIYIVDCGIDIEFPNEDSPFSNAVNSLSLDVADAIKLAKEILKYYDASNEA